MKDKNKEIHDLKKDYSNEKECCETVDRELKELKARFAKEKKEQERKTKKIKKKDFL